MNREAIIANAKKKYASADEATIDAVLRTLQETNLDWRLSAQSSTSAAFAVTDDSNHHDFVGNHLSLEQYRKLSLKERGALQRQLKEQNRQWLEKKFADLHAAWLMILDGKIIDSGDSLKDYPSTEQIREIGLRHGKRPFVFINDLLVAIEESGTPWHRTVYRNDFYPAVSLVLRKDPDSLEVTADFDTALAGRDLFLELQPSILLDFANRRTRLVAPEQA